MSGCGDQRDERLHNQPEPKSERVQAVDIEQETFVLSGDGLAAAWSTSGLPFGAARTEVDALLRPVLGSSLSNSTNSECGAGPIASASYPGGLTVNYQEDRLVGWFLADAEQAGPLRVASKFGTENTVSDLRSGLDGFEMVDGSTLGNEFTSDMGIGGFLDENAVDIDAFYAGTNCFFR
ncbi:aspartate-semialdehyde dehydrogenase [Pontixanthobacter luteolus]|uniref:aspartate-semialdehyde dehydrogenase n=1 Tax=Pontixanthobacter luteolus TaxID=295089 RepID=UPI0023025266|nr:aspartate-semialdehyde dehydrogenase [Pontixanthobacter luteolus]